MTSAIAAKKRSETDAKRWHVSRSDLARLLGCTPDRVGKYIVEGMPVVSTGNGRGNKTIIALTDAVPWLLARKAGTFDDARTRYYQAQSAKVEAENRKRGGELVEIAVVAREFADCAGAVKARLRRIPDAVADRVLSAGGPHGVKALLLMEIDAALAELATKAERGSA